MPSLQFQDLLGLGLFGATAVYAFLTWRIVNGTTRQASLQAEANAALRDQARAQIGQVTLQSFMEVVRLMEPARADRAVVRTYTAKKQSWEHMAKDNKLDHLDNMCRAFDILGLLDRHGLVDPDLIDRFYAPPLVDLWDAIMGSYVDELRKPEKRGKTHFWELNAFYHRIRQVPAKHPGVTGAADWPEHPRQARGA